MHEKRPIAFYSKAISSHVLGRSVYEKELMAIVHAVRKWRNYLLRRIFLIRTDHRRLKYLLEQRVTIMEQERWIVKLLGFDYWIEYQPGKENKVADALSRLHGDLAAISCPKPTWLEEIHAEARNHLDLITLKESVARDHTIATKFTEKNGLIWFKGCLVIPSTSQYNQQIIHEFQNTPVGGHSGILRTYKRISANLFWIGMKRDIRNYIHQCDICQRHKYDTMMPAGLLQPLPIPERVWEDISMDFIDGLPNSNGFSTILVVANRLSKYGHFVALKHPYSAKLVAEIFVKEIACLHGMPRTIVSDRDPIFTSQFWEEFFRLQGSELRMSSAYHPQTDGQTEVLNRCLETYMRGFASSRQKQWSRWLPWAEYWYNTSYQTATQMTPFEVVYEELHPLNTIIESGTTTAAQVENNLCERDALLKSLRKNLQAAQDRMKLNSNRHRRKLEFEPSDFVYLKLQPFRQMSIRVRGNMKLSPRFYGPFRILARVGKVAYHLELLPHSRLHPVFHVSQLEKQLGQSDCTVAELPDITDDGVVVLV